MARSESERFPTTAWSLVNDAADRDGADYVAAMNRFVADYWKPIYCFLRAKGRSPGEAEDLTQEFFLQMIRGNWIERADAQRGKFRNFILKVLVRFLSDRGPKRAPRQHRFENSLVPVSKLLTEEDRRYEPPAGLTAEEIFERRWAAAVLSDVRGRLLREFEALGKSQWCEIFSAAFLGEDAGEKVSQEELAVRFSLTRAQVRYALDQVKSRFLNLLRDAVRDQNADTDLDDEVRRLLSLAGR